MFTDLIIKFVAGGGIIAAVSLLAQKGLPQYAGILMTFPVITIMSLLCAPEQQLVSLGKYGLHGLVLTVLFIAACLFLYQNGVSRLFSIILALLLWLAAIIIYIFLFVHKQ